MDEQSEHLPSCEPATVQTSEPEVQPSPSPAGTVRERRHPRIKCFLAVQLRPADDQSLRLGKLSDVSLGGCGVESANFVEVGIRVALCPLAADGTLWVQGVVVNIRVAEFGAGYHIGVRFQEGDAAAPTQNVLEFVRFVEETAARQDLQETYLGRLTRAAG
jgi:c-di-GMP-binding flagellar brake protein YcgR